MKRTLFLSLIFCFSLFVSAQDKISVVFNEKMHDFGTIREEDNKVTTVFSFINTSTKAITIKSVKASCGCTTPSYSREPVVPNGEGKVTVAYSASGRPGKFTKNITVQIGDDVDTRTETLTITGEVVERVKTVQESFVYTAGGLLRR
ncbi:MAG: DUF1573 domain-containing protein, partial [Prevotellaceae bacterium]|nr:DUF1573 domain-containing protein [Prevotellaceae bacterium]